MGTDSAEEELQENIRRTVMVVSSEQHTKQMFTFSYDKENVSAPSECGT